MKYYRLSVFLWVITSPLFAQSNVAIVPKSNTKSFIQKGRKIVSQSKGDLNKDGLPDWIIVTQDTVADTAPYRLQVFFTQPDGQQKLIVSSDKIIAPQFPNGKNGLRSDAGFESVTINNQVITIKNQLTRGMFSHKFRYQHGNFELIGFKHSGSDGLGSMYNDDFNLSSGIRFYKEQRYDTGKIITNKKEKKLIRPLPKLQDYVPFEKDL
ncbi:hypothetical protein [Pedobacter cryoconitis]|uniref:Uncharacterized protein n=1 Tax=Pedobacter cryoconitis TaxID=188932 RepID=A0A327SS78_9SPHI|nr:hypothetical protein [Pedobacter cryoconitis]RAJ32150.1 hypothetical protein LY11_01831 [Pedobacter cryoconitis]